MKKKKKEEDDDKEIEKILNIKLIKQQILNEALNNVTKDDKKIFTETIINRTIVNTLKVNSELKNVTFNNNNFYSRIPRLIEKLTISTKNFGTNINENHQNEITQDHIGKYKVKKVNYV